MKPLIFLANIALWLLVYFAFIFLLSVLFFFPYKEAVQSVPAGVIFTFYAIGVLIGVGTSTNKEGMLLINYPVN